MEFNDQKMFRKLNQIIHDTAYAYSGGLERLADLLEIKTQVFRNKINQNNEQNKINIYEAIKLMVVTEDTRLLDEVAWIMGYEVNKLKLENTDNLLAAIVNTSADHGKVHLTIEEAVLDKVINDQEMEEISTEINDAIDALQALHKTIENSYIKGVPAR